jgi:ATP-dependent RNA helicase DeaD
LENFHSWDLNESLVRALDEAGYENPTPVQAQVIPYLNSCQSDLIALAQTGTGKTAAFGIPLLQRIQPGSKNPTALILCPTRELCLQITRELEKFSRYMDRISITPVYGGAAYEKQEMAFRRGTDIIVATPGRLMDHLSKGKIPTDQIQTLVLDEADEMLNMGFREELEKILKYLPEEKEVWLFSATLPEEIRQMTKRYMENPFEVTIGRVNQSADKVKHQVWWCRQDEKPLLLERLIDSVPDLYGIVFTRTRKDAQELAEKLLRDGYTADALHGELSQAQRDRVMTRFRNRDIRLLVATDVAARGIDINDLTHVVHYTLPDDPEVYIHRSGRTARAGKEGISLVLASRSRSDLLKRAEKMVGKVFDVSEPPTQEDVLSLRMANFFNTLKAMPLDESVWRPLYPQIHELIQDVEPEEILLRFMQLHFGKWVGKEATARAQSRNREGDSSREGGRERGGRGGREYDRSSSRDRDRRGSSSRDRYDDSSRGRSSSYSSSSSSSSSRGNSNRSREARPAYESRGDFRTEGNSFDTVKIGLNLGIDDGLGKRQVAKLVALATGLPERSITDVRMHGSRTEFKVPGSARKNISSLEKMEYPDKKLEVKVL